MEVFVKSKNIKITKKELKSEGIGNFYSGDRYYTLLNEYIDTNLKHKSKTLHFIITYLFRSGNYKHNPSIANGRSIWPVLLDIFCVFSFITFIALLFATFGVAIFQSIKNISGITNVIKDIFVNNGGAPMLVLAVIFGVIGIMWLIMFFKIRKKNAKLSLKDYVLKKVDTILKFRWLIKSKDKAKNTIKVKNKDREIFCVENFESQGGAGDRWLNVQLINLLISIFPDFNLIFRFNNLSDAEYEELAKIADYDFKNIELLK